MKRRASLLLENVYIRGIFVRCDDGVQFHAAISFVREKSAVVARRTFPEKNVTSVL